MDYTKFQDAFDKLVTKYVDTLVAERFKEGLASFSYDSGLLDPDNPDCSRFLKMVVGKAPIQAYDLACHLLVHLERKGLIRATANPVDGKLDSLMLSIQGDGDGIPVTMDVFDSNLHVFASDADEDGSRRLCPHCGEYTEAISSRPASK